MSDIDCIQYPVSPKQNFFPIMTTSTSNGKSSMGLYNDTTPTIPHSQSKQERLHMFKKLNEYKFPIAATDSKPPTSTVTHPTSSAQENGTQDTNSPQHSVPPSPTGVSFQDLTQSPKHSGSAGRYSHRRSFHTVSGSSTDSIFSDMDTSGSRYSSVVSGNMPKHVNFEEMYDKTTVQQQQQQQQQQQPQFTFHNKPSVHPLAFPNRTKITSSIPQVKTDLIDLDVAFKPLRAQMRHNSLSAPTSDQIDLNVSRRKSLGGLQDETIDETDGEDGELNLIDFLRESVSESVKTKSSGDVSMMTGSTTSPLSTLGGHGVDAIEEEATNPFEHIHLNQSIDFDPTNFRY